jgi:hypothetical protein
LDFNLLQPFTNDFSCADIHKIIALDLLHQLIKGTNTSLLHMAKHAPTRSLMTSIKGKFPLDFSFFILIICNNTELQLLHHSLTYNDFLKAEDSINGPGMIQSSYEG